jgi:hypothetical protein
MLMALRGRKGQNTAEYAILIGLVVAAALGIQTYVKRGLQGRIKDAGDAYYDNVVTGNVTSWNEVSKANVTASANKQFEPGLEGTDAVYSKMTEDVTQDTETKAMETGGTTSRSFSRKTQGAAGDYRKYDYTEPTAPSPSPSP